MFKRIKSWFIHRTIRKDTEMNVVDLNRGKSLRKIKKLHEYIKEYTEIKHIKQTYLNSLQKYANYHTIKIECHGLQQQIKTLDSQLADMDQKLVLLKKEL